MTEYLSALCSMVLRIGAIGFVANEVRGLVLAGPVLYGMYQAGGTLMAIWTAICSLAGIAISVAMPMIVARRLRLAESRSAAQAISSPL
jgi:hypothetical protein